uniref:Uncharacterized protein n=1 Tax=Photinus pyralis TaxID=7054 RepID=A0A1Y1NNJ1_PHOPY
MALGTDEFISAFHSLDGVTIAERKNRLFKLLHQNRNSAIDLGAIRPSTALEETFQADAVIFFKNHAEMLKLLNNENAAVIGKVLKDVRFIRYICENVTGESLVTEIFPNISYNAKLKLLSRLAVVLEHPAKGDEYFHCVMEAYGLYFAAKLLPSCSEDLILKTLEMNKVELTPKQLLLTIQRNPSQTLTILEKLRNPNVNLGEKYAYVFRYLMKSNPSIVIELGDKCTQRFRLGKRATRRFLFSNKALFVEHAGKLHSLLVEDEIGRCLPKEMAGVLSSLLPKSLKDFWNNLDELLSLLDPLSSNGEKLDVLMHAFEERYGADLLSFSELLVPKVFQWMSPDFKRNWMQTHGKPKGLSEEMWVSFMNCDESIGLLKKKLSCASNMKDRAKLVTALVRTCKVNSDLVALAEVCEYVASMHKNDHVTVKQAFFETLHQEFKLETLGEEHWKPLRQLIQACGVNYASSMMAEKFIIALVHFSLRNDQPIGEHLKLYVKISYGRYNLLCFNPEYEKRCLNTFYEVIPSCFKDEELKDHYVHFLHCIYQWNVRHPRARMSVFSFKAALDALMATLQEIDYYSTSIQVAIDCVLNEYDKACEVNLVELLFTKSHILPQLTRVIKCYPSSMFERLESFTQNMFKCYTSLNALKHLFGNVADSNLRLKIAELCKEEIDNPTEGDDGRRFAMYILSFVSTSEDFVMFAEQFFPKEPVANLENPNYNLQQAIPSCFRYFNHALSGFDPILRFCQGDYMQFAQKSLYHIAHNTAERRLPSFLNKLGERAVSVRKHSVYLSLKLLSKSSTKSVLGRLTNSEKNASIRKSLLQSVLNNFLRNPDAHMWELVQQLMKMIDADDVDAFKIPIVRLKRVSKQSYSDYISFAWKSLDRLASADVIEENRCKILAAICSESIALLPEEFCMDLIRAHLFTGHLQERMCSFASSYLLNSNRDNLPKIFGIIRHNLSVYPKITHTLISELCTSFINCKFANDAVFIEFVKLWDNSVKPFEALPEHIRLHFTLILLNSRNRSPVQVGSAISKFYLELHDEDCGDLDQMKKCFREEFKDHLLSHLCGSDEENHMIIVENVVNYQEGPLCLALGLSLLPDEVLPLPKVQKIYNAVIEKSTKCSNPCVQIALRKHLINKE